MKKMMAIGLIALGILPLVAAVKVYPTEDAYIDDSRKSTNINNDILKIGYDLNKGVQRSYLKFDLTGISATNAVLSVYSQGQINSSGQLIDVGLEVYSVSDDSWQENSLTWNNAPVYGNLINNIVTHSPGRYEMDVTPLLGENTVSIAILSSDESQGGVYTSLYSKELPGGEFYWPYIELDGQSTCNTQADTDCDGCVDLLEYNDFKYGYKNGLFQGVTLTEYNDIKYGYKNGVINC